MPPTPPSARHAAAVHMVEYQLRIAGGNAELVRKCIARCRQRAMAQQNWALVDTCTAQLAALALRGE